MESTDRQYQTLASIKSSLDSITETLFSRKPLLHLVVLFAADVRVRKYAEDIQEMFLDKGIHCYLQMEFESQEYIKPDNLIEVIGNSPADYLIVIGDRNMKNRTCHAKKSGKLVEIPVVDRITSILSEWHSHGNNKNNLLNKRVEDLSKGQLQDIIQQFTEVKYVTDRFKRLKQGIVDLKKLAPKKMNNNYDEKFLGNLTATQSGLIRLHKDILLSLEILNDIPVEEMSSSRGISISCIEDMDLGLSASMKDALITECKSNLPVLEKMGANFSEFSSGTTLWDGYLHEIKNRKPEKIEKPILKKKEVAPIVILRKEDKKVPEKTKPREVEHVDKTSVIDEKGKGLSISTTSSSWKAPSILTPTLQNGRDYEESYPTLGKKKDKKDETKIQSKPTQSTPVQEVKPQHYHHFSYGGDLGGLGDSMWGTGKNDSETLSQFEGLWGNNSGESEDGVFKSPREQFSFNLRGLTVSPHTKTGFPRDSRLRGISDPPVVPVEKKEFFLKRAPIPVDQGRQRAFSDAILEKDATCVKCNNSSLFECNFCANLRIKGVDIPQVFFCSSCFIGYKDHQKSHEKLRDEYKIFL